MEVDVTSAPTIGIYDKYKISETKGKSVFESSANLSSLLTSNVVDKVKLLEPSDYVKQKKPLHVYVSSLLRTWETAFLFFIQFLKNNTDSEYTPILVLVVSPFLREEENSGYNASNKPGDLFDNIMQFLKFIDLIILLSHGDKTQIEQNIGIYFASIPKKFNIILEITSDTKLYISVDATDPTNIIFSYDLSKIGATEQKKQEIETYVNKRVSISKDNAEHLKTMSYTIYHLNEEYTTTNAFLQIRDSNPLIDLNNYFKYNNEMDKEKVNLPYSLTTMDESNFIDFNIFSKYFPDIFNYLKWVIHVKKHPKDIPIFAVSHSGTMKNFLKKIFYCLNKSNIDPTNTFILMFKESEKTNLWSFRLSYMGYSVIIFRHGFTCDNMYKEDSPLVSIDRIGGYYTNLNIWGILSIVIFYTTYITIFNNLNGIQDNILSIRPGFPKQPKNTIITKNEITCGSEINKRFNYTSTDGNLYSLNFTSKNIELESKMQLMYAKPYSYLDSGIDKNIGSLISIEFTTCPSKSFFGSTFGCIKLSCLYNERYVIIFPYTNKSTGARMYTISFYDGKKSNGEKSVTLDDHLKNMLEYESILLYLFNYEDETSADFEKSVISNFNISSVINILTRQGMQNIVEMLTKLTDKKIDVDTSIYST